MITATGHQNTYKKRKRLPLTQKQIILEKIAMTLLRQISENTWSTNFLYLIQNEQINNK